MTWLLSLLTPFQWIVIIGGCIMLLLINGKQLLDMLRTVRLPGAASTSSDNDEVLDVLALHRLEARAERLGCPEAQDAITTYGTHFFHKEGHDKPAGVKA